MAEERRQPEELGGAPSDRHDLNCGCRQCLMWFNGPAARLSGICFRCTKPIDDHLKDAAGRIERCP